MWRECTFISLRYFAAVFQTRTCMCFVRLPSMLGLLDVNAILEPNIRMLGFELGQRTSVTKLEIVAIFGQRDRWEVYYLAGE